LAVAGQNSDSDLPFKGIKRGCFAVFGHDNAIMPHDDAKAVRSLKNKLPSGDYLVLFAL
jgi:hypothetical protein